MAVLTCLTGSYPPSHDLNKTYSPAEREKLIQDGIARAVADQVEAGISLLTDGQIREDIHGLFLPHLRGCVMPNDAEYVVVDRIGPSKAPITVPDFQVARAKAPNHRFKAHITGPCSLVEQISRVGTNTYRNKYDPRLIIHLAEAMAVEAQALIQAGASVLQIDEPSLAHGADLDLALKAMQTIVDACPNVDVWLHACGDTSPVLVRLLKEAPVKAINVESRVLEDQTINRTLLEDAGKKICYGCIIPGVLDVEIPNVLRMNLSRTIDRFGAENIAAITPNCGFRRTRHDIARKKLIVMVQAVHALGLTDL